MKESNLYKVLRPLIKVLTNLFFTPTYKGLENIPKQNKTILAGNHTGILDCFLLISSTKRNIHFLAKQELWQGPKRIIFAHLGLIPVKRDGKDQAALEIAKKYLEDNQVIGVFPEGTTEKGRGLLSFKIGAVKMAYDTKTTIVPFTIKGKYKLFSKDLVIEFDKPISIKKDLETENKKLRSIINQKLKEK